MGDRAEWRVHQCWCTGGGPSRKCRTVNFGSIEGEGDPNGSYRVA